jgi:hypothetical protein
VTRGVDAANDLGEFVATLRHNPGECECPPWEIAIGTRWERVAVVPARDAGDDVTAWLNTPAGEFETVIEVSREETRSETGWGYRILLIGGSSRPTEMEE